MVKTKGKKAKKNSSRSNGEAEASPPADLTPSTMVTPSQHQPQVLAPTGTDVATTSVIPTEQVQSRLNAAQKERKLAYTKDLLDVWTKINELKVDLAEKHRRSLQSVEADLHIGPTKMMKATRSATPWNAYEKYHKEGGGTGRNAMIDRARDEEYKATFYALTESEKQALKERLEEERKDNPIQRPNNRSKVNDINRFFDRLVKELIALRLRTGVETMVFATRGSTNLMWDNLFIATEGVKDYCRSVGGIDPQEFLTKMEGYALAGIKGAALSYKTILSQTRTAVRLLIDTSLREVTGNTKVTMEYTQYWKKIVERYKVVIVGWPADIRFGNLSSVVTRLDQLRRLRALWEDGTISWQTVSAAELRRLNAERAREDSTDAIATLDRRKVTESKALETGDKRPSTPSADQVNKRRKTATGPKSAEFVNDDEDYDDGDGGDACNNEGEGSPIRPGPVEPLHSVPAIPRPASLQIAPTSINNREAAVACSQQALLTFTSSNADKENWRPTPATLAASASHAAFSAINPGIMSGVRRDVYNAMPFADMADFPDCASVPMFDPTLAGLSSELLNESCFPCGDLSAFIDGFGAASGSLGAWGEDTTGAANHGLTSDDFPFYSVPGPSKV